MLDIALPGTGGMMPLPRRYLTSLMLRFNGASLMIDCGEGTQIALRKLGWSCKPINTILFTHFHADHVAGLPGMLLTMGNSGRTEPVTLIGPKGMGNFLRVARVFAPELPYEPRAVEISDEEETFSIDGMNITAFRVNHRVTCYGYKIEIPRAGRFDVEKAKANDIPLKFWNPLQKGAEIEYEGRLLTPDMVLGGARRGLSVLYATDTRPTKSIVKHAAGVDLAILEGMYGERDKVPDARTKKHMMMQEAAKIAAEAQPKELWLTHYSPSMVRPDQYLDELQAIFPETKTARDGWNVTFLFDGEDE